MLIIVFFLAMDMAEHQMNNQKVEDEVERCVNIQGETENLVQIYLFLCSFNAHSMLIFCYFLLFFQLIGSIY